MKAPAPRDMGPASGVLHAAKTKPNKTKSNPSWHSPREHAGRKVRECEECATGWDSQPQFPGGRTPDPRERHRLPVVPESWFSLPTPCLVSSFLAPILTLSGGCHFHPTGPDGSLCLRHIWLWALPLGGSPFFWALPSPTKIGPHVSCLHLSPHPQT